MRHKSPELMDAIKEFVNKYYREHQRTPSTPTIAAAVGVTRNTAYRYLIEMNERGIHGKESTPFLLATVKDLTGGESLESNIRLVYNNAALAAKTAAALNALR